MPTNLHFNFKDIPRAMRIGWSAKKMWVAFLGLVIGTVLYSIFTYIALLVSGQGYTLKELWNIYRYIPIPTGEILNTSGYIFFFVGLLLFAVVNFLAGVAISKITYEQLKGDEFFEVKKAINFALKEGRSAIYAPFWLIVGAFILIVFGGIVLGLIGKLPWLGEIILLLLAIPAVIGLFFILYLIVSFVVALFLSPAVVATTKSDTFDVFFEVFSSLNEQNWRFISYETLLYGTKILGVSIFIWAWGRVIAIAHSVLGLPFLMGAKYWGIENAAHSYFVYSPLFYKLEGFLSLLKVGYILNVPPVIPQLPLPQAILGFLFGLLLYAILFTVISYWLSIHWVGNTLIFLIIAKKKDDLNLLEVKEEKLPTFEEEKEKLDEMEREKGEGEETQDEGGETHNPQE